MWCLLRQHDCSAGLTWLVHAQRLALLVPAELAAGACFHRYVTVLALGASTAQVATVTQAAQEKFLKKKRTVDKTSANAKGYQI